MNVKLLPLLLLCGCAILPAGSEHVHEGDLILSDLAYHTYKANPESEGLRIAAVDANEHAQKRSGIPLPDKSSIPWDALGPFGAIAAGAYGLLQKKKATANHKLARELRDLDPVDAKKRYEEVS